MATNGYQGQVAAINYTNRNGGIGFSEGTDIYDIIQENLSPTLSEPILTRLGIQASPGTKVLLKNSSDANYVEIIIGETGLYEINDVKIKGLQFGTATEDAIIDYIVEGVS